MIPLVAPGKYDIGFNQDYLIAKLHLIDIYKSYVSLFLEAVIILLFIGFGFYLAIRLIRRQNKQQRINENKRTTRDLHQEIDDTCDRFHELCRLIYEDKHVFGRPDKMIKDMYYTELEELIRFMSLHESIIRKKYAYLIPDYLYYKKDIDGQ
jgi:hypothetical protein